MKTAREILHEKASQYNDGFLSGQVKWIVEAMEEYAAQLSNEVERLQKQLLEAENYIGDLQKGYDH